MRKTFEFENYVAAGDTLLIEVQAPIETKTKSGLYVPKDENMVVFGHLTGTVMDSGEDVPENRFEKGEEVVIPFNEGDLKAAALVWKDNKDENLRTFLLQMHYRTINVKIKQNVGS